MFRKMMLVLTAALLGLPLAGSAQAAVWFVNPASASQDGTTWATGYHTVAQGIAAASAGDQVWVKAATYGENLLMKDGVAIYGGFAGAETALSLRNITANTTVLDGGRLDPSRTPGSVIQIIDCTDTATRVDGFTITNGLGDGDRYGEPINGGGVFIKNSSPTIANNVITDNEAGIGGGISCYGPGSPVITGNTVTNNRSLDDSYGRSYGGGISTYRCTSLTITGNTFSGNYANFQGAGLALHGTEGTMTSITVTGNTITGNFGAEGLFTQWDTGRIANNLIAGNEGSGIQVCRDSYGVVQIVNNTVVGNANGIAMSYGSSDAIDLANNIVASNTGTGVFAETPLGITLVKNDVFGNADLVGNAIDYQPADLAHSSDISLRPDFLPSGDYRLKNSSPCINAGDNSFVLPGELDIAGRSRIRNGIVDMGCNER